MINRTKHEVKRDMFEWLSTIQFENLGIADTYLIDHRSSAHGILATAKSKCPHLKLAHGIWSWACHFFFGYSFFKECFLFLMFSLAELLMYWFHCCFLPQCVKRTDETRTGSSRASVIFWVRVSSVQDPEAAQEIFWCSWLVICCIQHPALPPVVMTSHSHIILTVCYTCNT